MAEPMLELVSVEVRYGAVPAVRGVSFRVAEGEIVGLIGPNGAGKSTTLHAITGLVPTHAGHIRVEGESVVGRTPERIAQSGVSLVPEGRRIYADFTVEENLRLGLAARRGQGGLAEAYELFPMLQRVPPPVGRRPVRRAAAAARDRAGLWSQSRGSSCSTSRPSAWPPPSWPRSSRRSPASGSRA